MSDKVSRFEDVIAWQKARVLTARIYQATGRGRFERDFGLKDQIRRAAVSIMSNIAEGFERGKPSEFHQFLSIAKGSCAELRSQLYIASDAGYLDREVFNELMTLAVEVGRIVGGLRAAVERKRGGS
ncbi:MAG TPA: four helix bundle protein [Pyrinomonadaceae bacterium]